MVAKISEKNRREWRADALLDVAQRLRSLPKQRAADLHWMVGVLRDVAQYIQDNSRTRVRT